VAKLVEGYQNVSGNELSVFTDQLPGIKNGFLARDIAESKFWDER
jgi:hypothetical protein